jgi:hypothetical protein
MQKQPKVLDEQKRKTADYKHPLKFCNLADTNPDLKTKDSIAYICLCVFPECHAFANSINEFQQGLNIADTGA